MQQALTRGAGGLVHPPAPLGHAGAGEVAASEEERGNECGVFWMQMPSLWCGEDATVVNRTDGIENSMQRVWHEVQVREAGTGIPVGGEFNVHVNEAFKFASEGFGAQATEGDVAITASSVVDESKFNFRHIQQWR
ncbi:hypothetical protein GYH30_047223 [Glycine max]|nr:hypothetical protein GYH30_047223 [Glycine max]